MNIKNIRLIACCLLSATITAGPIHDLAEMMRGFWETRSPAQLFKAIQELCEGEITFPINIPPEYRWILKDVVRSQIININEGPDSIELVMKLSDLRFSAIDMALMFVCNANFGATEACIFMVHELKELLKLSINEGLIVDKIPEYSMAPDGSVHMMPSGVIDAHEDDAHEHRVACRSLEQKLRPLIDLLNRLEDKLCDKLDDEELGQIFDEDKKTLQEHLNTHGRITKVTRFSDSFGNLRGMVLPAQDFGDELYRRTLLSFIKQCKQLFKGFAIKKQRFYNEEHLAQGQEAKICHCFLDGKPLDKDGIAKFFEPHIEGLKQTRQEVYKKYRVLPINELLAEIVEKTDRPRFPKLRIKIADGDFKLSQLLYLLDILLCNLPEPAPRLTLGQKIAQTFSYLLNAGCCRRNRASVKID